MVNVVSNGKMKKMGQPHTQKRVFAAVAAKMASTESDYGAFMEKFVLEPISSPHQLTLSGLIFAVKDIFDVEGHVTGFGNPDWARTHCAATSTTGMDEMAYRLQIDASVIYISLCEDTQHFHKMEYRAINDMIPMVQYSLGLVSEKAFPIQRTHRFADYGILVIPTVPGPQPKLQMDPTALEAFCARALSLLPITGVSGFCQVSLRLGLHDNLPVAVSLLAKHGSDRILLNLVKALHQTLKEEIQTSSK